MQGFTELTELQLNVSIGGESYFRKGITVNWAKRAVRVELRPGEAKVCPMENVVWLSEPDPSYRCERCGNSFMLPNALAAHIACTHDRRQGDAISAAKRK